LIDSHNQFVCAFFKAKGVPKKAHHFGVIEVKFCDARGDEEPKMVPSGY
jgi:hypothetical protein